MGYLPGKRHIGGDWHFCARSGMRCQISEMVWEQGSLIWGKYADGQAELGLLGARDADIARRIEYATSDFQPDPKLSQPNQPDEDLYF
jgi:hypothetical protein